MPTAMTRRQPTSTPRTETAKIQPAGRLRHQQRPLQRTPRHPNRDADASSRGNPCRACRLPCHSLSPPGHHGQANSDIGGHHPVTDNTDRSSFGDQGQEEAGDDGQELDADDRRAMRKLAERAGLIPTREGAPDAAMRNDGRDVRHP